MSAALPDPLTPADCDLRDFPFMPLLVARLRRSKAWLMAKRQPELGFYMVNLWTAAWHDFPAASLEDDDDVLADLAMCDPKRWLAIREKALHGWVKCSDGRLYHQVVAEQANDSWAGRQSYRERLAKARAAKAQKQSQNNERSITDSITEPVIASITEDVTVPVIALKGQGQGQGQGQGEVQEGFLGEAPKQSKRDRPRTRIPSDWQPDDGGKTYAVERGIPIEREVPAFRNHHAAKGNVMADWPAAWRTWCDNAVKYGHAPGRRLPMPASDPSEANPLGRRVTPMSGSF